MRAPILLLLVLSASAAHAQSHRGSLGLNIEGGFEALTAITSMATSDRGFRAPVEVGGTLGVFDHGELTLSGRLEFPVAFVTGYGVSFYGGLRNSFGYDQWKTFFSIELAIHAAPFFTAGARAGFGVLYDVLPIVAVYAVLHGQLGGGVALRLSGDLSVGVQFRTYLF
ncbi:MAG: hypothetical protein JNM17_38830 [Archangium sp.]|nr:hypothetical protein [Archangium sp.]